MYIRVIVIYNYTFVIMFTCQYCIKTFDDKKELNKHKKGVTPCLTWEQIDTKWQGLYAIKNNEISKNNKLQKEILSIKQQSEYLVNENKRLSSTIKEIEELKSIQKKRDDILRNRLSSTIEQLKSLEEIVLDRDMIIDEMRVDILEREDQIKNLQNKIIMKDKQNESVIELLLQTLSKYKPLDVPFWNEVNIIAEFLSKKTKSRIKKLVVRFPCKDMIEEKISKEYHSLMITQAQYDFSTMIIDITLAKKQTDDDLCSICFVNSKTSKALCSVCKIVNICSSCDLKQLQLYNKCAFCNTLYD